MVAAGFDPDSEAALCMEKDHTQGGLLNMSDKDRNHVESALKTKNCLCCKNVKNILHTFWS